MLHCHVLWNNGEKKGVGILQFGSDFILGYLQRLCTMLQKVIEL